MGDKRTDSGQYYPGGRVIARPGTAPQQVVVQWSDVQGKPQVAPLPERYREDDMKGKINEIASKFATALAVALVGWTAFAGVTVHKARMGSLWNDEQIVTNVTYSAEAETDPTVPAWAKQANPPGGMPMTGLVWNVDAGAVKTASGSKTINAADVSAVPLVEDVNGKKTAVTIGDRVSNVPVGEYSFANGNGLIAFGFGSHAEGWSTVANDSYSHAEGESTYALAKGSHTSGISSQTLPDHDYAYAWNGDRTISDRYQSHGEGTYNINPVGGLDGFWIGEQTLASIISIQGMTDNALVLINGAVKTKSGTAITPSDVGAAAAGDVEKLNIGYTRLYNFSLGSTNANFTATNYPPTKAEADARCHFKVEPGMDFSKVPASLQLNEYRDGERRTVVDTRDWPVWYFNFKERQLTNEIARLRAENVALSNKVEAAKSWADRTANGVDNPMTDTVVVDRPNLWLMADYEWQKVVSGSNQCFVIRAKNVALSGGANTNGFLEFVDAFGKPYMRINKSSDTFADPVFDEIYWDKADGAWYVVFSNKTKPTKGGANVALRGNGDGKCIFFEETDPECPAVITWPDVPESHSGHWIMKAVPKPIDGVAQTTMFFGAEIKVPGSDYVEYLKEASFGAGVRFGNNVYDYVESGDQLILRRRK